MSANESGPKLEFNRKYSGRRGPLHNFSAGPIYSSHKYPPWAFAGVPGADPEDSFRPEAGIRLWYNYQGQVTCFQKMGIIVEFWLVLRHIGNRVPPRLTRV